MGSNPIARSKGCGLMIADCQSSIRNLESGSGYGVVAKWQGKGLQNPHHGFKSHRRLYVIDDCGLLIAYYQSAISFFNDVRMKSLPKFQETLAF